MKNYGPSPVLNVTHINGVRVGNNLPPGGPRLSRAQQAAQANAAILKAADTAARDRLASELLSRAAKDKAFRGALQARTEGPQGNAFRKALGEAVRNNPKLDNPSRRAAQQLGAGTMINRDGLPIRTFGDVNSIRNRPDLDNAIARINTERNNLLSDTKALASSAVFASEALAATAKKASDREVEVVLDQQQDDAVRARLNNAIKITRTPLQSTYSLEDAGRAQAATATLASMPAVGPIDSGQQLAQIANARAQAELVQREAAETKAAAETEQQKQERPTEAEVIADEAVEVMAKTVMLTSGVALGAEVVAEGLSSGLDFGRTLDFNPVVAD